jgi:ABC transporter substrate binding protein
LYVVEHKLRDVLCLNERDEIPNQMLRHQPRRVSGMLKNDRPCLHVRERDRRAADYVDKILRGTKPSDIPVEQPTKFDLVINLTSAKALNLEVPSGLSAIADEVIE